MTGAACHACAVPVTGTLAQALGVQGEPLGTCQVCHAFACGHHGQRDPIKPAFVCVECDPKLLQASAGQLAQAAPAATPFVADLLDQTPQRAEPAEPWLFRTLEEFMQHRPRYGEWLMEAARSFEPSWRLIESGPLRRDLESLPSEAWRLLAAAGLIAYHFRLPAEDVARPLQVIVDMLHERNR